MTRASFDDALAAAEDLHRSHPEVSQFTAWDDAVQFQRLEPHWIPSAKALPLDGALCDGSELDGYSAFCAPAANARWRTTYKDADIGEEFNQKFGCYQLIGAEGHFFSENLNTYLVYAEKGLFYPWHHHPAEELYVIIAGEAVFEVAGRPPRRLGPGDTAFHASNQPHAMTTEDKPVLAYVLWRGDLKTPPILTPEKQQPCPKADVKLT